MISTVWLRETNHYTEESLSEKKYLAKHPSSQGPLQCLGLCTLTAKGLGSIHGWGTKIPQATVWHGQKVN